jgi:hypothetical protein
MSEFDREEAAFRAALTRHAADAPTDLPEVKPRPRRPWWIVSVAAAAAIMAAMVVVPIVARDRADRPASADATSSTTKPTPTGADARSGLAVIPTGPAPAEFIDRAEQVAKAIRASGDLTDYQSGLRLLSPVVTVPDNLPNDELETAFNLGLLTPGPAVTEEPTTTSATFADGTTRKLEILGARSALKLGRRGPSCADANSVPRAVHLDPCPVVVNRARLTTRATMTNHGAARLPAWEFWADGLTRPYVVLAVDPRGLQPPPKGQAMPARSTPERMLDAGGLVTATEASVTVLLFHGACDRAMLGHVWEAPDLIVVGGTDQGRTGDACPAVGIWTPAVLQLKGPLGTRPIVDVGSGRVLIAQR